MKRVHSFIPDERLGSTEAAPPPTAPTKRKQEFERTQHMYDIRHLREKHAKTCKNKNSSMCSVYSTTLSQLHVPYSIVHRPVHVVYNTVQATRAWRCPSRLRRVSNFETELRRRYVLKFRISNISKLPVLANSQAINRFSV